MILNNIKPNPGLFHLSFVAMLIYIKGGYLHYNLNIFNFSISTLKDTQDIMFRQRVVHPMIQLSCQRKLTMTSVKRLTLKFIL